MAFKYSRSVRAAALALFLLLLLFCRQASPANALSKYDSTGDEVIAVQTKLKELGYYKGNIDGIYGSGTKSAVTNFQKANGLSADGIAGVKTLAALGITKSSTSGEYTESEIALLARIISAESRGPIPQDPRP